ncbi:MAG: tRNA (adenosine(37)-N6)-dimethylallyltransferase MiaA [Planctomycetota bacterium]
MDLPRTIVILGNTAGGKSELAVALAERLDGEVISADSMQVYRHMDAGTAKPTPDQRRRAPHHLIDVADPREPFTVADWLALAERAIADITARGKHPIVVGGTNLYLNALLRGLMPGPEPDAALRTELNQLDNADLHAKLAAADPAAAARIHVADRKRLVRALEVIALTGEPISAQQTQWQEPDSTPNHISEISNLKSSTYRHDPILLGLAWGTDAINHRINKRVRAMFFPDKEPDLAPDVVPAGESLPDEVARLDAAGLLGTQAREALGYKQVLAYLHRDEPALADPTIKTLDDAFKRTKVLTRRFGKQQRTWMKRYLGVRWIEMPCDEPLGKAMNCVTEPPLDTA